jgi:hypothetical protein
MAEKRSVERLRQNGVPILIAFSGSHDEKPMSKSTSLTAISGLQKGAVPHHKQRCDEMMRLY